MTEEEAKTKMCPHLSECLFGSNSGVVHRLLKGNCVASKCMMWKEERKSGNTTYAGGCGLAGNV